MSAPVLSGDPFEALGDPNRRAIVELPLPLKFSRQFTAGRLLRPDHREGRVTFEDYLARRYPGFRPAARP